MRFRVVGTAPQSLNTIETGGRVGDAQQCPNAMQTSAPRMVQVALQGGATRTLGYRPDRGSSNHHRDRSYTPPANRPHTHTVVLWEHVHAGWAGGWFAIFEQSQQVTVPGCLQQGCRYT
jgi:hypothetical protein